MDAEKALAAIDEACLCRIGDCDETLCHAADLPRDHFHCRCCSPSVFRACTDRVHADARTLARAAFEAGQRHEANERARNPAYEDSKPLPKWLTETSR